MATYENDTSTATELGNEDWDTGKPVVEYDFDYVDSCVDIELQKKARQQWRLEDGGSPPPGVELDGNYKYVAYIPPWTAPDWDDEKTILVKPKGAWDKTERRLLRRDVTMRMRPAILAKDQPKNPTPWAKRYGINPDVGEGRSRMSPERSDTRRIGLSKEMETPSGRKAHIDHRDLAQFKTLADFETAIHSIRSGDEEALEVREAMRQLYENIMADKDYQRIAILDQTTDERVENLYHTLDEDLVPNSDLDGPLHELVQADKWWSPAHRGASADYPRFLYNINGRRGEYNAMNSIQNDTYFWCAIQPALQLVMRILNSQPVWWKALLDIYTIRQVRDDRDPRLCSPKDPRHERERPTEPRKSKLTCIYDGSGLNEPAPDPLLEAIKATGYRSERHLYRFLCNAVGFEVVSGFQFSGEKPNFNMKDQVNWGQTDSDGRKRRDIRKAEINIEIAAEIIWPLMVDEYTRAEKALVSFLLAGTILHELGHALVFAREYVYRNPAVELPILYPEDRAIFSAKLLKDLDRLGKKFLRAFPEPYWRDEPVQEADFAFENTLFGGNIQTAFQNMLGLYPWFQLHVLDCFLVAWPNPVPKRRKYEDLLLMDPPCPIDSGCACFPLTEIGRLFQKSFWNGEFLKFGIRSLSLAVDQPRKAVANPSWTRRKDVMRCLGRRAARFLAEARDVMEKAGQALVAEYIARMMAEGVKHVWVRKRWSIQHKRLWKWHDKKWAEHIGNCSHRFDIVAPQITKMVAPPHQLGQPYDGEDMRMLYRAIRDYVTSVMDVVRHLGQYLRLSQLYMVEYLKLAPEDRRIINLRHSTEFENRMKFTYAVTARKQAAMIQMLIRVLQQRRLHSNALIEVFTVLLQRLITLAENYERTATYMGTDGADFMSMKEENFVTVSSGGFRSKAAMYEKLAIREIQLMPPYLRNLADKALEVLGKTFDALKKTSVDELSNNMAGVRKLATPPRPQVVSGKSFDALEKASLDATPPRPQVFSPQARHVFHWSPQGAVNRSLITPAVPAINPALLKNLGIDTPPFTPSVTPNPDLQFGAPSVPPGTTPPMTPGPSDVPDPFSRIPQPTSAFAPPPAPPKTPEYPLTPTTTIFHQGPGWSPPTSENQRRQTVFQPNQGPTYTPFGTGISRPTTAERDMEKSLIKRSFSAMFGDKAFLDEYVEVEEARIKRVKLEQETLAELEQHQGQGAGTGQPAVYIPPVGTTWRDGRVTLQLKQGVKKKKSPPAVAGRNGSGSGSGSSDEGRARARVRASRPERPSSGGKRHGTGTGVGYSTGGDAVMGEV